ncbi:hypothetical protein NESM_000742700 [Novymonas esmeraldas]|uniref:Uncharacterized protein n=1 Tax=Novymonas esmeraldas TaxID=1808958 RepID=A0AAW0EWS7_9TRYP
MRDVVTLFIEASVGKGEWRAALSAIQLLRPNAGVHPCHEEEPASRVLHLSNTLAAVGEWKASLAVLRTASLPCDANGRVAYSPTYLAGRLHTYQSILEACCRRDTTVAATGSSSSAHDSSACAEQLTFDEVFALATEAFGVRDGAAALRIHGATASPTPSSTASLPAVVSADADACAHSAAHLLHWCSVELPRRCTTEGEAARDEVSAALQRLKELSVVALEGVSNPVAVAAPSVVEAPVTAAVTTAVTAAPTDDVVARPADAPPRHSAAASHAGTAEDALKKLLASNTRVAGTWSDALGLLRRIPASRVSGHLFKALLELLLHQRRGDEVLRLVRECLLLGHQHTPAAPESALMLTSPSRDTARALTADSVALKAAAEVCHRLQAADVAAAILWDAEALTGMTPSVVVPLVMTLRNANADTSVCLWWEHIRQSRAPLRYPLLRHAKLSSYVASCVLRSTRVDAPCPDSSTAAPPHTATDWRRALDVFRDAEAPPHDPGLVLLFQLRLLRQAGQWEAAVQLFSDFAQSHPAEVAPHKGETEKQSRRTHSRHGGPQQQPAAGRKSAVASAYAVLTEERAAQWVPPAVIRQLRRDT